MKTKENNSASHPVYGVLECLDNWGIKYVNWNFHMKAIQLPNRVLVMVSEKGVSVQHQYDCGLGVGSGWITKQDDFVKELQQYGLLH